MGRQYLIRTDQSHKKNFKGHFKRKNSIEGIAVFEKLKKGL